MATAIKYIRNQSSHAVQLENNENGMVYPGIMPGEGCGVDELVPWCWSQEMFDSGKRILIRSEDQVFAIWQHDRGDGDFVRSSSSVTGVPTYEEEATPIAGARGAANAGGDRVLIVREPLSLYLDYSGGPLPELYEAYSVGVAAERTIKAEKE